MSISVVALILSAGRSSRFGSDLPKQYNTLNGKEVIAYSIDAMHHSENIEKILISASKQYVDRLREYDEVEVIMGGDTRNQSLRNGLDYIKRFYPKCEKVFIHEAARPFITTKLIDDYLDQLEDYDAVITTQYITDSLGKYGEPTVDRSQYYLVQAPEAFRFDLLYKHFDAGSKITATSQQLPFDSSIYLNFDFRHNLKITNPEDLAIAESLRRYLSDKNGGS